MADTAPMCALPLICSFSQCYHRGLV